MVEQGTHNPLVVGSSPAAPTTYQHGRLYGGLRCLRARFPTMLYTVSLCLQRVSVIYEEGGSKPPSQIERGPNEQRYLPGKQED